MMKVNVLLSSLQTERLSNRLRILISTNMYTEAEKIEKEIKDLDEREQHIFNERQKLLPH